MPTIEEGMGRVEGRLEDDLEFLFARYKFVVGVLLVELVLNLGTATGTG
jgi:hypothetical protein